MLQEYLDGDQRGIFGPKNSSFKMAEIHASNDESDIPDIEDERDENILGVSMDH